MWNQILKTETVTKQMLPSLLHRVNSTSWQHLCLHFCFVSWRSAWSPAELVGSDLCRNQQGIHVPFLAVPPGFCRCAFDCYDAAKKRRRRRSSQLVVMNVSQSVWNFCLTSQPAQFLLCCMLRQQYTLSDGCQWQQSMCVPCLFFF